MTEQPTPEQLQADAERARMALGRTAQELAEKLDVQARAKGAVAQVGVQVKEKWDELPLPEPVRSGGRTVAERVSRRPAPVLAAAAGLLVVWRLAARRRRSR
jgi:hypothetical protein